MCLRWWWCTHTWTHGDLCLIFHTLQGFTILTNHPWDAEFCLPVIKKKVCTEQKQGNDESLQVDMCVRAFKITTDTSDAAKPVFLIFISFLSHWIHVKRKCVFSMSCVIIEWCGFKSGSHPKLGRGSGHPMCRAWYDVRDVGGDRMRQETNSLYIKKKKKKERKCIIKNTIENACIFPYSY